MEYQPVLSQVKGTPSKEAMWAPVIGLELKKNQALTAIFQVMYDLVVQGLGDNIQQFIPCLHFFFVFLSGD